MIGMQIMLWYGLLANFELGAIIGTIHIVIVYPSSFVLSVIWVLLLNDLTAF